MSQENVEVVRGMYAAFGGLAGGGDIASYVATHWAPDAEYDPIEETGTIRGRDELVRWHERWFEAWDEFRAEVDEIIEAGDVVVAAITVHGRGGQSGTTITQRLFHVCETRDGKLSRMGEYSDRETALKAAGWREEGPTSASGNAERTAARAGPEADSPEGAAPGATSR